MKRKNVIEEIFKIPAAIVKNEFTLLQAGVCTVLLAIIIFGGLFLLHPSILNS